MAKATVKWKDYDHVAWSAGYCPHCQDLEPVRVQDVIEVVAFFFIPVQRRVVGRNALCDFCERPLEQAASEQTVNRWDWVPTDGVPKLLNLLGVKGEISPSESAPDAKLRSLLSATEEASALKNVNILGGLVVGLFVGIAIGIPLGILLFDQGMRLGARDRFGAAFVTAAIGAIVGGAVGATLHGLMIRTRTAERKIVRAHRSYALDVVRLSVLSHDYNTHVRHAVQFVALKRQ